MIRWSDDEELEDSTIGRIYVDYDSEEDNDVGYVM